MNKEWYLSKTIWSCVVALAVATASAMYGETSPLVAGIIAIASAFGVYGRTQA